MKRALTYTIISGSKACPYDCGICISKMTPDYGISAKKPNVNWNAFDKATETAVSYGAQNILITGKGEPTLFPEDITEYLFRLKDKPFNTRELQTNGSIISNIDKIDDHIGKWKEYGLETIALSIYHHDDKRNEEAFKPKNGHYFNLSRTIDYIHSKGLKTRLSCVMLKDYIDNPEEASKLIEFSKQHGVEQLTLRSADRPVKSLDQKVAEFVDENRLSDEQAREIEVFLEEEGELKETLLHGAKVYTVNGQNVCLTTGLTNGVDKDDIRHLIFFPQGWLTTSWEDVEGGRIKCKS